MADFIAQLGSVNNQGLLADSERLQSLKAGENPYVTGNSLIANSGVFFGRRKERFKILSALRNPNNPASVSLLGERRIGKTSLLNQLYKELAKEDKLISIQTSTQNWKQYSAKDFFKSLHQCLADTVNMAIENNDNSAYEQCRDFIASLAEDYRFVLMIDEFELIASNDNFDADFFSHLRGLGDTASYRFSFVISSRRELQELCRKEKIEASMFWNIFGVREVLNLLDEKDAKNLLFKPLEKTLGYSYSDRLWNEVKKMTGCHPLLIQLVAFSYWNCKHYDFSVDEIEIKMNLRRYLKDWFYQRSGESQQQWQVLVQAAGGKNIKETPASNDLYLRGLLLKNGDPFCLYFAQVIREEFEDKNGCSIEATLNEMAEGLEKGVDIATKFYNVFLKGAALSGKVRQQFLNPDSEDDG